jgi:hypothetical protein
MYRLYLAISLIEFDPIFAGKTSQVYLACSLI